VRAMSRRAIVAMVVGFVLTSTTASGPSVSSLDTLECPVGEGPVRSEVIFSDSLSTMTFICIDTEIRPHVHERHTELVQVLDGEATMLLGDTVLRIGRGMVINIPFGTPHAVRVTDRHPLRVLSIQSPQSDGSDRVFVHPQAVWEHP
jgi:mannose-6-phosphate isomerase-like protein (cupin superfamily)